MVKQFNEYALKKLKLNRILIKLKLTVIIANTSLVFSGTHSKEAILLMNYFIEEQMTQL